MKLPLILTGPLVRALKATASGLCLLVAATGAAAAQDARPTVVEMFTAFGCANCPPAYAVLADLAGRDDVLALDFHISYWDYIGFPDPYADAAFIERQRGYAMSMGVKMIYTPQAVVDGAAETVGARADAVAALIAGAGSAAEVAVTPVARGVSGDVIEVAVSAHAGAGAEGMLEPAVAGVFHVLFERKVELLVTGGDNAGRHLSSTNVVRALTKLSPWTGDAMTVVLPNGGAIPAGHGAAVLVQNPTGRIVGVLVLEGPLS